MDSGARRVLPLRKLRPIMTVYFWEDDILEAEELPEYDERDAADEQQQIELDERNPDENA